VRREKENTPEFNEETIKRGRKRKEEREFYPIVKKGFLERKERIFILDNYLI